MQVNVAGIRRNIKNLAHNYSDAQVKVREATSNDPWGPSATIMAEVADLTYNVVAFSEIMQMIWKRLNDHGKNWRHVYKALILLEYLIKTGTEKVAQQCKENIFAIQTLRDFTYFEEGKDQGTHVREKAKTLVNLLKDDERLKNERIKALKAKERFSQNASGFGSDGYIDGPVNRENQPADWQEEPKPVSDLEFVRPQTAGEEELQLQLAMAMSREEAEQEEAKRRSDDVRLQLALSQSENDFKVKPDPKGSEPQQSHLLDLLDISLGATSISSPPLGAGAVGGSDPWGTPARAASQLSDPWSGTSSPQIDPWHANVPKTSGGAAGGAEGWLTQRTQSPSVASGSSNEGWLQSNILSNGTMNGNSSSSLSDPWLSKTAVAGATSAAPPPSLPMPLVQNTSSGSVDPWLPGEEAKSLEKTSLGPEDPWAPKAQPIPSNNGDPWKRTANETTTVAKVSPDLDDFDIITNRNKTGGLLDVQSTTLGSNNNNASLLDELDPLSSKKPSLKTPQSFLGENSALVNLDNLIKPVAPSNTIGSAAYNPFSDTIPPKTNLFQQQQPPVPSINQLKQQQPFAISLNQDPWAPVSNAAPQCDEYLIDYDSDQITVCTSNNIYAGQFESNNNNNNYLSINNDSESFSSNNNNNNNSINNNIENSNCNSVFDNFDPFIVPPNICNINNYAPSAINSNCYSSPLGIGYVSNNPSFLDLLAPNYNQISNFNAYNGNLFGYGYFDSPNQSMNPGNMFASSAHLSGNNNNNNNLAWIKPEAAASNPFL
ncbi:epsin-2 isoform X2 [Eupeodes corollae]|nr:epsin-2 isoform X2 [Eupeodes corollae]